MKGVLLLAVVCLYAVCRVPQVESKAVQKCSSKAISCGGGCQGLCRSPFELSNRKRKTPTKPKPKKPPRKPPTSKKPVKKKKKPVIKKKPISKKKPIKKPKKPFRKKKPKKKVTKKKKPAKKPSKKRKGVGKRDVEQFLTRVRRAKSKGKASSSKGKGSTKPKKPIKKKPPTKKPPKKKPPPKSPPKKCSPITTVYRTLRDDENPNEGIRAKDPSATKTVQSHVGCGCRPGYKSQYISTTLDYNVAVRYGGNNRIVKIDVNRACAAGCKVIDLSDGGNLKGLAKNFARASKEVLLHDCIIPPDAITLQRNG